MSDYPSPVTDPTSEPYWQALRERKFTLPHCSACDRSHFYPRQVCPHCGSTRIEWRSSPGEGVIYSLTRVHRAPHPAFADKCPYVIALVELQEGPRMMAAITDGIEGNAKIGDRVVVEFNEISEELTMPAFRLDRK